MESLVFAFNSVAPIVIMVAAGYFLKKSKIIGKDFSSAGNRLVFRLLLPVMLFGNVYKIENIGNFGFFHVAYSVVMTLIIFSAAGFFGGFITKDGPTKGSLIQGIFRSNYALIGIPLAGSLFGSEGTSSAAVLSAFVIPLFNVLAVAELLYFSGNGKKPGIKEIALDIIRNPLIQGVAAGFVALGIRELFISYGIGFRLYDIEPVEKVVGYISSMATPLSLIVLGADFEFSAISSLKKEIVFGTAMRCAAVPLLGIGTAFLLFRGVLTGAQFAAITALFTAPVAVSSVPMAQEMGGNTVLSGQLVVWTTIFSAASVFVASFLLKSAGVF